MARDTVAHGSSSISSSPRLRPEVLRARIQTIRKQLGAKLLILGHHYQHDSVIEFADLRGDSFLLARHAAENKIAHYIVFLGVRFMAETADIITSAQQTVILPEPGAGCMMADMANAQQVRECWEVIQSRFNQEFIPITYVNSSAEVKAFCGKHGGLTCTSSSAVRIFRWALAQGKRILFLPDEHLGRNTGRLVGISLEAMSVWDRHRQELLGSSDPELILWNGYCPIHAKFNPNQIYKLRQEHPGIQIIVHPECPHDTAKEADDSGSTEGIIGRIRAASPGSSWAIGTEINLVRRLGKEHSEKNIRSLDERVEPCSDMMKTTPVTLLWCLEGLLAGEIRNQITVDNEIAQWARVAIERMLKIGS
ncbi:MAG: quinolinate synthase NadA [Firmicutes bacterium]|nr:quinolinate synthase NadA [Bacillota bacterium]